MKKFFLILCLVFAASRPAIAQDSTIVMMDSTSTVFLFPIGDGSTSTGSVVGIIDAPQKFKIKPYIAPAVCVFIAGVAEGCMDVLQFHYGYFKKKFPNANDQFWYPDISWQNRRGKYFPFVRDGWHLLKTVNHGFYTATIVLNIGQKTKWYWYVVKGVAYWAVNRAGFHLTYNIIFK